MSYKDKSIKQLQVGELIKREIAKIFSNEDIFHNKDLRLTVLEADISPDLKNVKVYLDIIGILEKKKLISSLNKNNYFFKKRLGEILKLRNIPNLKFILDSSSQNASEISKIIDKENNINQTSF